MKIKIYIIIFMLVFFKLTNLYGQNYTLYGDHTFGGNGRERWVNIIYVGNNQFVLSGSSITNINGDKNEPLCTGLYPDEDVWILKIDTGFNIIWERSIGGDKTDQLPFLIMTGNNGSMIFSCRSFSDSACEKSEPNRDSTITSSDYWMCMLDSNGNKIWDKTLGGTDYDEDADIIKLSTGEFVVCGSSYSLASGDKTVANYGSADYWTVKLDALGNRIWDKVYGGNGNELGDNGDGFYLLPTEGGSFIIAGTTTSPISGNISDSSRGGYDIWIIKIDNAGNKIWDKRFGGSGTDRCHHIIHTDDGGYMVCGETMSPQGFDVSQPARGYFDYWLIKLDSLGNKQWDKRYGGMQNDVASYVAQAPGGGYWVCGSCRSDSGYEVSEPKYALAINGTDYWILKTDSAGNKLWDKRFGGPGGAEASNFIIMPDSSIYLCGTADSGTSAVKTDAGKGNTDYWIVHFKYGYTFTGVNEINSGVHTLAIVPNPAKDICTITAKDFTNADLMLYDITGRVLLQQKFNSTAQLSIAGLAAGVYIAEVREKGGRSAKGKIIKE